MFDVSLTEIGMVALVALLVIRPEDMPAVMKTVRKGVGKFRDLKKEVTGTLEEIIQETELKQELKQITDLEGKLQDTYDLSDIRPDLKFKDDDPPRRNS